MKFADIWPGLIGQDANIVVPRVFVELCGGLEDAVVLADLVWWQAVHGDWFWRTDQDIATRQAVSVYAVGRARAAFKERQWLSTDLRNIPPKLHYKLHLDIIGEAVSLILRNQRIGQPNSSDSESNRSGSEELLLSVRKGVKKEKDTKGARASAHTSAHADTSADTLARAPESGTAQAVVLAFEELVGYPMAPTWARQAAAAKTMIKAGYTQAEIIACAEYLMGQPFWSKAGAPALHLQSVSSQIGVWKQRQYGKASSRPGERRKDVVYQPAAADRVAQVREQMGGKSG